MQQVRRFDRALTAGSLEAVLAGEERATETLSELSLDRVQEAVDSIPYSLTGSEIDSFLIEPLHRSLAGLRRSEAADMRLWHWLCAAAFPSLVWRRWRASGAPGTEETPQALTAPMVRRFLGNSTLAGVSRNTLARLWWTAEHLGSDYDLARAAIQRQDPFQAIFERLFGISEHAAHAAVTCLAGRSEDEVRDATRWLNYVASTTVLEILDEEEITAILLEVLDR